MKGNYGRKRDSHTKFQAQSSKFSESDDEAFNSTFTPSRLYHLNLSKLRTKHSIIGAYKGHFSFMPPQSQRRGQLIGWVGVASSEGWGWEVKGVIWSSRWNLEGVRRPSAQSVQSDADWFREVGSQKIWNAYKWRRRRAWMVGREQRNHRNQCSVGMEKETYLVTQWNLVLKCGWSCGVWKRRPTWLHIWK